jgi:hypothetical protein
MPLMHRVTLAIGSNGVFCVTTLPHQSFGSVFLSNVASNETYSLDRDKKVRHSFPSPVVYMSQSIVSRTHLDRTGLLRRTHGYYSRCLQEHLGRKEHPLKEFHQCCSIERALFDCWESIFILE